MKKLLLLTAVILTVGLLPVCFGGLQNVIVIGQDFFTQQIPFIIETKRMFATGAPWWSWTTNLGENFLAAYSFYTVTSPFVWIACMFPVKYILWGILLSLYLKTLITSAVSYAYLRMMGFNVMYCTIGALLYTFSCFYVCNLFYYHFCEPIMAFPLLLIGVESYLRGSRHGFVWLALSAFVVMWLNYYFAVSSFMLGAMYFVFRSFDLQALSIRVVFRAFCAVSLGVMLSSVILLPTAINLLGVPRASIYMPDYFHDPKGVVYKMFQNLSCLFVPSAGEGFPKGILDKPHTSSHGFIVVTGYLLALLYVIKHRKTWLSMLLVLLAVIFITPLNGIFTLYTNPEYHRWLYGLIILAIVASLKYLDENGIISSRQVYVYVAFSLFVLVFWLCWRLYVCHRRSMTYILNQRDVVEILLLVVNMACLLLWKWRKFGRRDLLMLVSICSCANMFGFTTVYYNSTDSIVHKINGELPLQTYILDNEAYNSREVVEYFSRFDDECRYSNNHFIVNRPSIMTFHSVFNKNVVPFRSAVDTLITNPSFHIHRFRDSAAALLSVSEIADYGFCDRNIARYERDFHKPDADSDTVIHPYRYYIPMGFAYDRYITESELLDAFNKDSVDIPLAMLSSLVVPDGVTAIFNEFMEHGNLRMKLSLDSLVDVRRTFTADRFVATSRGFAAHLSLPRKMAVFFSVPHDEGFSATDNGSKVPVMMANLGMSAIILDEGEHDIVFKYFPPGLRTGSILTLIALILLIVAFFRGDKSSGRAHDAVG